MTSRARLQLIAGTALAVPFAPLHAQQSQQPQPAQGAATRAQTQAPAQTEDEEEIVVKGKRPRGWASADIQPENLLHIREGRATGGTNFEELLVAIAPETGVAGGSGAARPLVLLNGRRVSSYRELRDTPTEAVSRSSR